MTLFDSAEDQFLVIEVLRRQSAEPRQFDEPDRSRTIKLNAKDLSRAKRAAERQDDEDVTLLDVLQFEKADLAASCGGMGTCGTCRVRIKSGAEQVDPMNEIELEFWQDRDRSLSLNHRYQNQNPQSSSTQKADPNPVVERQSCQVPVRLGQKLTLEI